MKSYNRFTTENTEGYSKIELYWMNEFFDSRMAAVTDVSMRNDESYQDFIAERILELCGSKLDNFQKLQIIISLL